MPNEQIKHKLRRYIEIGCLVFFALLVVFCAVVFLSSYFPSGPEEHEITRASCERNISECEELYEIWIISLNQRVFEWSLSSGKMIFWLSVMLTISGMVFSFWQFWEASNVTRQSETGELHLTSEALTIAFKFKSIGAMMLFLSVVYLAIYAIFIYPINVVDIWSSLSRSEMNRHLDVYEDRVGTHYADPIQADPIQPETKQSENE